MANRPLPTGTLTFLFTDLEGSTRLLHELGDAYGTLLETHRRLIRDAVGRHGGLEFGTGGDALFVVFESATNAIAAAAAAQRVLDAYAWPDDVSLRVRMAIHTGEVQIVDGDYVGMPLHVAARLCSVGHGGQVLISDTTHALVQAATVDSLGTHRLRDVPEALEVFQLRADGLVTEFPSLKTLTALPNNLPAATDRMVDRELEVVEVAEALTERRLVTLIGPGGSGKTRLSLEVGAAVLPQFRDGVWFVGLGAATTADQVVGLTAQVLQIGERGGESLGKTVLSQLAPKEVLLVIDNCEHLVDAVAGFLGPLLERCPSLRVLATSREVLGLRGEQAMSVSPLPDADATRLFVERARAAVPAFDEATEDPAAIAQICRRLDGLPLAIELAAARLRGVSLRQIADRLDDRFRLLGSGRGRTLEAIVSWSYDLLDSSERAVFRRLAIFADSFDLEGAEAIAGWGDIDQLDVLEIVTRLVDKSLVVPLRAGEDYRYRILETLRHYGRAQLLREHEVEECTAHLNEWATAWSHRLEVDMRTTRQDASLAAAGRERENLRAVYEQARARHEDDLALRVVTFAPILWMRERYAAIDDLLAEMSDLPDALRGHALTAKAQFAFATGRPAEGLTAGHAAAELFAGMGDRRHAAWARYFEVFSAWGHLDDDEVRARLEPLLAEFRAMDETLGLAYMLWVQSQLEPDVADAESKARESEAMFRAIDSPFGLAHCLEGRALISLRRGETACAAECLEQVVPLLADSAEQGCLAHALEAVASLLIQSDRRADAALLLGAAEDLRMRSGHTHRPWELRSRVLAEEMLFPDDLDRGREVARDTELAALLAHTMQLLSRLRDAERDSAET